MLSRRNFTLSSLACIATGCDIEPDFGKGRLGFLSAHSRLQSAAAKEGALYIDATSDQFSVDSLLSAFRAQYPQITVEYHRSTSISQNTEFLKNLKDGTPVPDMLISSAMDLQFQLVNNGFAQTYESPEKPHLPEWAVWKDQAYAITAEPIGFGYNKKIMPAEDVPHSHDELVDLLRRKPDVYRGKIATYDPERSGSGYLYFTQDLLLSRDTLDFYEALGRTQPQLYVSGTDIIERISNGEYWLGYNMVSSYSLARRAHDPNIGIIFPSDYTLVMSRIAFIPKMARHPAASKLFLNFLLSEPGQKILAAQHVRPIRNGIEMMDPSPPPEVLRPIHLGPALLANLDEFRRRRVLHEWRRTIGA